MTDPINIILIIVILIGLLGTLLPGLPGTTIIVAGAMLHALLTGFNPMTWQYLLLLTLICLGGYVGQYLITGATSKKMGASKYGIIGACLGMVLGFLLPIPGGIFGGAFLGAVSLELIFGLKNLQEAMKSGLGALVGTLLSLFFEFMVGLGMATIIFYLLVRNNV